MAGAFNLTEVTYFEKKNQDLNVHGVSLLRVLICGWQNVPYNFYDSTIMVIGWVKFFQKKEEWGDEFLQYCEFSQNYVSFLVIASYYHIFLFGSI